MDENIGFFPVIVELEIPEDAKVVKPNVGQPLLNPLNDEYVHVSKYRTDKCTVKALDPLFGGIPRDWDTNAKALSLWELMDYISYGTKCVLHTVYKVGAEITLDAISESVYDECGTGIHFFDDKETARNYYFYDSSRWIKSYIDNYNSRLGRQTYHYSEIPMDDFKCLLSL